MEGRVDCGFTRIPTKNKLEILPLELDELHVIMPEGHPLSKYDTIPEIELCNYPFLLLEKDSNKVVSEIFQKLGLKPNIRVTTWDDYAIMAMVEQGFGISILPKLILQKIPYKIVSKCLDNPVFREIGFVMREHKSSTLAVKCFMKYLMYR